MLDDIQDLKDQILSLSYKRLGYKQLIEKAENDMRGLKKEMEETELEIKKCIEELKQKEPDNEWL